MCTAIEYCRLSTVLASCLAVEVQILMLAGTLKEISHVFCFQKGRNKFALKGGTHIEVCALQETACRLRERSLPIFCCELWDG